MEPVATSAPAVPAVPRRWPRGQKFTLSDAGLAAAAAHREAVNAARASGRAALHAALVAWAGPHRVEPGDGVLLPELSGQRRGLADLARAFETSGLEPADVKAAVDRLVLAGLAEPVPPSTRAG